MTELNRRQLIRTLVLASAASALPCDGTLLAQSSIMPTIIRWIPRVGRVGGGLAGLVVTEAILGVLRAYDIDIAGAVEDLVRGARSSDNPRPRRPQSQKKPRAQKRTVRVVEVREDETIIQEFIHVRGRCSSSGEISIEFDGYFVCRPRCPEEILVPSLSLWAALREQFVEGCLSRQRCGYPVEQFETTRHRGYSLLRQHYETGFTQLVIDDQYPRDIEAIYHRNVQEQVWYPRPV